MYAGMTGINDYTHFKDIMQEMDNAGEKARKCIAEDMRRRGYGAIVWGQNLFGSTDYPLIESDGKDQPLLGFRLEGPDKIAAIIALPDTLDVVGAMSLTPMEADKVLGNMSHSQGYYTTGGTPEQWEVAGDCYKVAVESIEAQRREDKERAGSWW